MKAALYARVSTERQESRNQIVEVRDYNREALSPDLRIDTLAELARSSADHFGFERGVVAGDPPHKGKPVEIGGRTKRAAFVPDESATDEGGRPRA